MGDSCIICLEELGVVPEHDATTGGVAVLIPSNTTTHPGKSSSAPAVAVLKPCNHVLHDECVREWSQKANSCPICRQQFNLVEVLDKFGGNVVSEYEVEDKKQVAEFDLTAWLEEEIEEPEDAQVCPVCNENDQPDILLLCDMCDASYHTTCIGLDSIPSGNWFCIECSDEGAMERAAADLLVSTRPPGFQFRRRIAPRTQASVRRNRQFSRIDRHIGAWGVFSNRIHGATGLDLDFVDDEGGSLADFRQLQARAEEDDLERHQWQRRLDIASAQGAGSAFINSVPARLREPIPQAPVETVEETQAWGAFDRAREAESATPRHNKRKSRSVTASPAEPPQEPERKLKRPRTRRVLNDSEPLHVSTASGSSSARPNRSMRATSPASRILNGNEEQPSFLSKILKEVEMAPTSDDDRPSASNAKTDIYRVTSPPLDFSSPAASPTSSSSYHTPRGTSITPPPARSGSPLSLTSRIEARYPPAAYSPSRSPPPMVNSELDRARHINAEIRQPRPRRQRSTVLSNSEVTSPRSGAASPALDSPRPAGASSPRAPMSIEAKEGINKIVKNALAPHWRSAEITKEQYAEINRYVSRKLYGIVADRSIHDERQKSTWEKIATAEVAQQVKAMVA